MKDINTNRQITTASPLGTFRSSNHLQSGKNNVATTAPMDNGIRNALAKYKPAMRKNNKRSFFRADAALIVMDILLNGPSLFLVLHQ